MYEGRLVRLRAYRECDAEAAQTYLNDAETRAYLSGDAPFPYTLAEEKKWIEGQSARKDTYSFAIETLAEGKYIGGCGYNAVEHKNRRCNVGIFIGDKDYWSRGYGSDALGLLLALAFDELNMHRVDLDVKAYNPRAIRCYEKLGFVTEGRFRDRVFHEGRYHDELHMSILEHEWRARANKA